MYGCQLFVDRVALQPRQNPDGIRGCPSATLVGKVIGKGSVARSMEPVQISVDAQSCFIEMHHRRTNKLLFDLFHYVFQTSIDAVGTDKVPEAEIRGAILACKALPVRVHLVGPEAELRDILDEMLGNEDLPIVIHHASERIGMEEKAAHAVRTKKESSMRVGLKLVREGKAAGFVTAGNTGAAMATAKMVLGACPASTGRRWRRRCPAPLEIPVCCSTWAAEP